MDVNISQLPVLSELLTELRRKSTDVRLFREAADRISFLLAVEATKDLETINVEVETPIGTASGKVLKSPSPCVVPLPRAGLGMSEGFLRRVRSAELGFMGFKRHEETLTPRLYMNTLPDGLSDRKVFVLDPMIAPSGTLQTAMETLFSRGAQDVTCISWVASPEGLSNLRGWLKTEFPYKEVRLFLASIDKAWTRMVLLFPGWETLAIGFSGNPCRVRDLAW